jgi:von Willebrand factor type A domain
MTVRQHVAPLHTAARLAIALVAGCLALTFAAAARADVTISVVTTAGIPLVGQSVTLDDSTPGFASSGTTNHLGQVTFASATDLSGDPPPYLAKLSAFDDCRAFPDPGTRAAEAGGIPDGGTATLTVDILTYCALRFGPPGLDEATGTVDPVAQRVLVPPGGTVDVDVALPSSATNLTVFAGGAPVGTAANTDTIRITAPAAGYEGPLQLNFIYNGQGGSFALGTMVSRVVAPPVPLPGPIDLEAIVDLSGSMGGTDPKFIRKDAMRLLVDLSRPKDKLGAVGFDDDFRPIFDLTTVTGAASVANQLKGLSNSRIKNLGGTDYNDGMDKAYEALTVTPGVDPQRQKGIIFLTDGAHNAGAYLNGHLRFSYNASGRAWPVCAVQLGPATSFPPADVARLKRIASETGGKYFATDSAGDLSDIYFRCFGLTTGQRTLASKTFSFKVRQKKQFRQRIAAKLPQATFFVGWGNGVYQVTLIDPRGGRHTAKRPGRGATFRRGATFAFFRINKPIPGLWRVLIDNVRLTTPTDRARANITTPKK